MLRFSKDVKAVRAAGGIGDGKFTAHHYRRWPSRHVTTEWRDDSVRQQIVTREGG